MTVASPPEPTGSVEPPSQPEPTTLVVDGSALFAILLDEPGGAACAQAVAAAETILISAASLAEVLIVATAKNVSAEVEAFVDALDLTVVPLTAEHARAAAHAYRRWGKGFHPAGLNMGDVFAYALARERDCPLLYVGDDFARTDIPAAVPAA